MTKFIIGTISNIDQPMTPAAKGERSLNLYMNKVSEEMIREERNQILDATQEDIRALYRVVEAVLAAEQICVIGSEEKIEEDREMFETIKNKNTVYKMLLAIPTNKELIKRIADWIGEDSNHPDDVHYIEGILDECRGILRVIDAVDTDCTGEYSNKLREEIIKYICS